MEVTEPTESGITDSTNHLFNLEPVQSMHVN